MLDAYLNRYGIQSLDSNNMQAVEYHDVIDANRRIRVFHGNAEQWFGVKLQLSVGNGEKTHPGKR